MAYWRSRGRLRSAAALCAATVALMVGTASTAMASAATVDSAGKITKAQGDKQVMGMRGDAQLGMRDAHPAAALAGAGGLRYGGGPVAHTPRVYLVFWGSQWNTDTHGVESYLKNYFGGVGTSRDAWSTIMTQYPDSLGAPTFGGFLFSTGTVLGGVWVDNGAPAPHAASQPQLSREADRGASHFGVSGPDADVFVVSPSGTHPDNFPSSGFCAWHSWNGNVAYTNMPYVLDAGASCGANSVRSALDGFSIVAGHEYAEAVTDPEPTSGWADANGDEIGDLCEWRGLTTLSLSTGSFAIQPLWSNSAGRCVTAG